MARPPLPLDVAVEEIKRLKTRVEDVSQRNTRYNLMGGADGVNDDHSSSGQQHQMLMHPVAHSTSASLATFHDLRKVWKAMGKLHDDTLDLKKLIDCQDSEIRVISLWGGLQADVVGELGWASILKKAYYDQDTCREFKNRAWIKLGTHHPFNPVEFLNNLLAQFTSDHHHRHHDDMSELMLQVSKHRYLIVIEQELSSVAEWNAIRMCLPDSKNGSQIVIFTKQLGLALLCTGEPYQISELKFFYHDGYICAILPEGCGYRSGMGDFIWQLRRHRGVISLFCEDGFDETHFRRELYDKLRLLDKSSVLDEVNFEYQHFRLSEHPDGGLAFLAVRILLESFPEDEHEDAQEKLMALDHHDLFERCREFLNEQDYLIFIEEVKSPKSWDLIKQHLLCESTRACIIVLTGVKSVAKYCVHTCIPHRSDEGLRSTGPSGTS